jgi:hypothetical protein
VTAPDGTTTAGDGTVSTTDTTVAGTTGDGTESVAGAGDPSGAAGNGTPKSQASKSAGGVDKVDPNPTVSRRRRPPRPTETLGLIAQGAAICAGGWFMTRRRASTA